MINPFDLSIVSSDAFREIFHSMTEGIIVVDGNGRILVANPVAEEMFAYETNEMTGLQLETLLPERYRGPHLSFRSKFNDNPAPRRMGMGRDLAALKKNGLEFPVEISLSYSKAGNTFIAIAFITDITLRKRAEEALKAGEEQLITYAAELEKKVQLRTEDLNRSVASLEKEVLERKRAEEETKKALEKERELNELKSKFVSIASHEFRTPLSTILSSLSLIDQYNARGDKEKITKHTARSKASVNHLTGILNDFLSLGRLEEGKVDVKREPVNLNELFAEVRDDIKLQLKEGQQILLENEQSKIINTDSRILRNILVNLLSNASKYSEAGKMIYISYVNGTRAVTINVRDEGIGIPAEDQKHMFDRFFRASNAGNIPGTGLGLNIVKRYADLLGGSVHFVSEYAKGTTFFITIPQQTP